jgi:hypothetical protein
MAATQPFIIDPNDPPTFEKVWALFQETDRRFKELIKTTEKQMKETDKKVGELTNRFGDMVEYMVVPNLLSKFRALNFKFEQSSKDVVIRDEENGLFTEIDVFLQNGDKVMVVEVKATPNEKNVNDHIERMELLRKYADLHNDFRKYRGAIAGAVFADSVRNYALKHGFYAIVPSGDTFDIIEPAGKYHVKEW